MWQSRVLAAALLSLSVAAGCAKPSGTWGEWSRKDSCTVLGAVVGSSIGVMIASGGDADSTSEKLAWGTGGGIVGGAAGRWICDDEALPPSAKAAAEPQVGEAPLEVDLSGTATQGTGEITGYSWDLGDGESATGEEVSHVFEEPGEYVAKLTVTDSKGLKASSAVQIRVVDAAPDVSAAPPAGEAPAIELATIHFDFDSDRLRPEGISLLQSAADSLKSHPGAIIELSGHASSEGSDEYNLALSVRRAESVYRYLTESGLTDDQLRVVGYGEERPIVENDTEAGRSQNRRVEMSAED